MKSAVETLSPTRVKLTVEVPFEELSPAARRRLQAHRRPGHRARLPQGQGPHARHRPALRPRAVLEEAVNEAVPAAFDDGRRARTTSSRSATPRSTSRSSRTARPSRSPPRSTSPRVRPARPRRDRGRGRRRRGDRRGRRPSSSTRCAPASARSPTSSAPRRTATSCSSTSSGALEGEEVEDLVATALSYEVGGTEGMLPGFDEAVAGAVGRRRPHLHLHRRGRRVRGQGHRRHRRRSRPCASASCPTPTTTSPSWPASSTPSTSCTDDLRTRLARVKRVEQGVRRREKVAEQLARHRRHPAARVAHRPQVEEHFADGHGDEDHRAEVETETRERAQEPARARQDRRDRGALGRPEAELSAWLVQQAPRYGMTPDQFAQELVNAGQVPTAVAEVRRAKALALVLEQATVVDPSGTAVDLGALNADLAAADGGRRAGRPRRRPRRPRHADGHRPVTDRTPSARVSRPHAGESLASGSAPPRSGRGRSVPATRRRGAVDAAAHALSEHPRAREAPVGPPG